MSGKLVLLIDDIREPEWIKRPGGKSEDYYSRDEVSVARDAASGLSKLKRGIYHTLLLDHDLGDGPNGMSVITFLEENTQYIPEFIYLVTANPVGRKNMTQAMERMLERGADFCFGWINA